MGSRYSSAATDANTPILYASTWSSTAGVPACSTASACSRRALRSSYQRRTGSTTWAITPSRTLVPTSTAEAAAITPAHSQRRPARAAISAVASPVATLISRRNDSYQLARSVRARPAAPPPLRPTPNTERARTCRPGPTRLPTTRDVQSENTSLSNTGLCQRNVAARRSAVLGQGWRITRPGMPGVDLAVKASRPLASG